MRPRFLVWVALLVVGGGWWAQGTWRAHRPSISAAVRSWLGIGPTLPGAGAQPTRMLRPPDPERRFRDLTPEQRVELARKPHGVGG